MEAVAKSRASRHLTGREEVWYNVSLAVRKIRPTVTTKGHNMIARTGDRVEIHPSLDEWMMGDRYGQITRSIYDAPSGFHFVVKLDKSRKSLLLHEDHIARKVS